MGLVRAAFSAFWLSMRLRFVSPFSILGWLLFPTIFAAVGLFLLTRPDETPAQVAYGVLGGGLLSYWGVAYLDGGFGIQQERWNGTLEQVFAAPTPFWIILVGKSVGSFGFWELFMTIHWHPFNCVRGFRCCLSAISGLPYS
jgi:ABC-2 type transport system permease protein